MKKILIVIFTLLLVGCQPKGYAEVDLLIYNTADFYMNQLANDLVKQSDNMIKYRIVDSQNSQLIQNDQIGKLLSTNAKILLVNPVDRLSAYATIQEAKAKDIPVIFFNREPLKEDLDLYEKAYYVGAKAEESAILQAELVIEAFGPADSLTDLDTNDDNIIQLVVLKGEESHQDAEIRTNMIINELERYGYNLEILSITVANWSKREGYEKMLDLIDVHGRSIELVISNNDAMAIGAIDALEENTFFTDIDNNGTFEFRAETFLPVVGIDGIPEALELVDQGKLLGTVLNDSEDMADKIFAMTKALVNGDDLGSLDFEITDDTYVWVSYKKISK